MKIPDKTSMENEIIGIEKKKKKGLIWIILLILAVFMFLIGVFTRGRFSDPVQEKPGVGMRDRNGMIGQVEGKTDEEIQEELNRIVELGMFNISINSEIVMEDGGSQANLRIENVPGNQYLMGVTITLDESGEVIYTSGLLEPNYHIQKVALDKRLEKGRYLATAAFTAYDMESEEEVGVAAAKIAIIVNN